MVELGPLAIMLFRKLERESEHQLKMWYHNFSEPLRTVDALEASVKCAIIFYL